MAASEKQNMIWLNDAMHQAAVGRMIAPPAKKDRSGAQAKTPQGHREANMTKRIDGDMPEFSDELSDEALDRTEGARYTTAQLCGQSDNAG